MAFSVIVKSSQTLVSRSSFALLFHWPQDSGSVAVEVLLTVEIVKDRILALGRRIRSAKHVAGARMVGCRRATVQGCWFPRHVSDLDKVSLG